MDEKRTHCLSIQHDFIIMIVMTHRERVIASITGRRTDRIPADYYGTADANRKYLSELNLKTEFELIEFLDTDVLRASPGRGRANFSRPGQYMKDIDTPEEIRRICEDIPSIDDLIDNTPLVNMREEHPDYAIMTYGPGSIFLGTNSAFGYETSLMHHAIRPELINEAVDCSVDYAIAVIDKMHRDVGDAVDIVSLEDDYGTQNSLYISYEMFVKFYKQAFAKIVGQLKKYNYYVQFHSCGAVCQLIPDFIEMGVDILDPVQVSAAGMGIEELARNFKGKICFHGGIDTQYLLPYGTPEEVKTGVRKIISALGTTGAFICPSQNFLPDIPTENLIAMYRADRRE